MKSTKRKIVFGLLLLALPIVGLLIFDPYFFYIDSCLDLGGRWNAALNTCEGSAAYEAWKARTIW